MSPEQVPAELRVRAALQLLPDFLRLRIATHPQFQAAIPIAIEGSVHLADGGATFQRTAFFEAIRRAYSKGSARLRADNGARWTVTANIADGSAPLSFSRGRTTLRIKGIFSFHPDPSARLQGFERAAYESGLAPTELREWRGRLLERPLTDLEVDQLNAELSLTPVSILDTLKSAAKSQSMSLDVLVPSDIGYYERLVGAGEAATLDEYQANVLPAHLRRCLDWDRIKGPRLALLVGADGRLLQGGPLADLSDSDMVALGQWLQTDGDLMSRVAFCELGLDRGNRSSDLDGVLADLLADLGKLDPLSTSSRAHFAMAAYVLVYGELGRTKILHGWPPFRRRLAAFAQAAVIERSIFKIINQEHFARWCLNERGYLFRLSSLVDMREEPKWRSEFASGEQLYNEFLGRLFNRLSREGAAKLPELLRHVFEGEAGLASKVKIPVAFWPGPLEGAVPAEPATLPSEIADALDESLSQRPISTDNLKILINLSPMLRLPETYLDMAVAGIEGSIGRLLTGGADDRYISQGLAYVAASHRRPDLAKLLRSHFFRRAYQTSRSWYGSWSDELELAITAAAAHETVEDWATFASEWAQSIAMEAVGAVDASQLETTLEILCRLEPRLRLQMGRVIAGLKAFIAA